MSACLNDSLAYDFFKRIEVKPRIFFRSCGTRALSFVIFYGCSLGNALAPVL